MIFHIIRAYNSLIKVYLLMQLLIYTVVESGNVVLVHNNATVIIKNTGAFINN